MNIKSVFSINLLVCKVWKVGVLSCLFVLFFSAQKWINLSGLVSFDRTATGSGPMTAHTLRPWLQLSGLDFQASQLPSLAYELTERIKALPWLPQFDHSGRLLSDYLFRGVHAYSQQDLRRFKLTAFVHLNLIIGPLKHLGKLSYNSCST